MPKDNQHRTERANATRRVTLVGAGTNVGLAFTQLVGGMFSGSQALIADGFHTLSDLVSDGVVLFAAHHAHKEADANHPYGHGRIETVATVVLGLLLAGVAIGIFLQAWTRLFAETALPAVQPIALAFAALALGAKETLFRYTMRAAQQVRSKLLEANAWHHRSDAISSVVVMLGISGAQLGFIWLDSVAAMVVAALILYMAGRMILASTMELVDTGMDVNQAAELNRFMANLPGVKNVHMLRTRLVGGQIFADAHIQVTSDISVSEGHHVAEYVMRQLKQKFPDISDVTAHIDPEDDEVAQPSADLPIRSEILAILQHDTDSKALFTHIDRITLHYIEGAIQLEIFVSQEATASALQRFRKVCERMAYIRSVKFFREHAPQHDAPT